MPAPYMVDRFNALAQRDNLAFEAWFSARREPHWSGPWDVDERLWTFRYRYVPSISLHGRTFAFPPALLGPHSPDVLISPYGQPSFVLGWFANRARGTRTAFWVVRTFERWTPRVGYKEVLKRHMLPRADAILTPGEDGSAYARRYGASDERIITVPHPVDSTFFKAAQYDEGEARERLRAQLGLRGVTFVYVGRLWWGKGLRYLLDAFEQVQRTIKEETSLMIVGSGPEEEAIRERCRHDGLQNVVFPGFIQRDALPGHYAAADVFVFPTLGDPFGLVVGEAMACGLPIVSTSAAGEIRERIEEGANGFIVPPEDSSSLADRMRTLATSPELRARMGRRSMEKVASHTPDRWGHDFEDAVERILALPPLPR